MILKYLIYIIAILISLILGIICLILGIKQKKKKSTICSDCGNELDNGKMCSKCGNTNIFSKKKMTIYFVVSGMWIIIFICLSLLLGNYILKSKLLQNVKQSNERQSSLNQIEVITEYINIRKSKNVSSPILGKVYKGEIYTVISEDKKSIYNWYEIETSNGIKGFISGKDEYVKVLETLNNDNFNNDNSSNDNSSNDVSNSDTSNDNHQSTQTNPPINNDYVPNIPNNEDNNVNKKPNNNSNVSDDTTINVTPPKEKKVIDATKNYYCENSKYTLNGELCFCEYEADQLFYCPDGYKSYGLDECVSTLPASMEANCYCSSGRLFGGMCVDSNYNRVGYPNCRCDDYRYYYNDISCRLKDEYKYIPATFNGYYCSISDKKSNSNICVDEVQATFKEYTCPSGYTLKETKCYEN